MFSWLSCILGAQLQEKAALGETVELKLRSRAGERTLFVWYWQHNEVCTGTIGVYGADGDYSDKVLVTISLPLGIAPTVITISSSALQSMDNTRSTHTECRETHDNKQERNKPSERECAAGGPATAIVPQKGMCT